MYDVDSRGTTNEQNVHMLMPDTSNKAKYSSSIIAHQGNNE